jgi:hypothetical protein
MNTYTHFNGLFAYVSQLQRFTPTHSNDYATVSQAYEVMSDYDVKRAYNLEKRLQNGLKFTSLEHLLDTVKNIPSWL